MNQNIEAFLVFAALIAVLAVFVYYWKHLRYRRTRYGWEVTREKEARKTVRRLVKQDVPGMTDVEFDRAIKLLVDKYHYGSRYGINFADYKPEYLAKDISDLVMADRQRRVNSLFRKVGGQNEAQKVQP